MTDRQVGLGCDVFPRDSADNADDNDDDNADNDDDNYNNDDDDGNYAAAYPHRIKKVVDNVSNKPTVFQDCPKRSLIVLQLSSSTFSAFDLLRHQKPPLMAFCWK